MHYTRRSILKNSGLVALGAAVVRPTAAIAHVTRPLFPDGYPDRQAIINTAIDAAMAAGATYADARLSHYETLSISDSFRSPSEHMAIGVRALFQGYWGFASSPIWSPEEGARLGKYAVAQAKANVLGRTRVTELAPITNVSSGHWEPSIKDNPFLMSSDEISDFVVGYRDFIRTFKYIVNINGGFKFERTNKAFGSSLGQFTTQVLYSSGGEFGFGLGDRSRGLRSGNFVEGLTPAGQGFEYLRDRPIREYARVAHEEALRDMELPVKPAEPGKYNVLIDQYGVGDLISQSIGVATEVDRVFGFEANAGGTSYINDPDAMLGAFKIGSSSLNVTCDRSQVGSVGRVQWDDEGVTPIKVDLVKDGILVNLQTNREGASWIQEYLDRSGQNLRSFGCAGAPTALDVQLVHQADLSLQPSKTSDSRDDLRVALGDGVELRAPSVEFDFQAMTGQTTFGYAYEIKNGKRVARLQDAGLLFRTPELWSNLTRVGGPETVQYKGFRTKMKGEPSQRMWAATYTPPATFKELTLIDYKRKA